MTFGWGSFDARMGIAFVHAAKEVSEKNYLHICDLYVHVHLDRCHGRGQHQHGLAR